MHLIVDLTLFCRNIQRHVEYLDRK